MSRLVLVGGGVRSGKSRFALTRARSLGRRRVFLATAEPGDEAMRQRIERHVRDRGDDFRTVEAPIRVRDALRELTDVDVVLMDCVTVHVSNLMLAGRDESGILAEVSELVGLARTLPLAMVIVTNEVGMSVHPPSELGRRFADVVGRVNQLLAQEADEVVVSMMGLNVRLKPAPVEVLALSEEDPS